MRKIFAIIVLAATLLSLLCGCGADADLEPIEKAQAKAVEIGQQYLDFELTEKEAKEKLDSIKVPETEGEGQLYLEYDIKYLASCIDNQYSSYEDIREKVESIASYDYVGAQAPAESGLTPEVFLDNLEEMLDPLADMYEMTRGRQTELEDRTICQLVTIEDILFSDTYEIFVYSTLAGNVDMIVLDGKKGERTNLDFSLLSFYIYKSMKLPEMDADAFYDEFKLLTPEPDGFLRTDGWFVGARFTETRLTFSVSFSPE